MENQNFQPIFDYIDDQTEVLRSEMASKEDIRKLIDHIDSFAKDNKDFDAKVTIVEHKAEKLEKWALQVAEQTNIPYEV